MGTLLIHTSPNRLIMKVFVTLIASLALAQGCPDHVEIDCGKDYMVCHGGMDPEGCPMPDLCMPADGFCPVFCGQDEMNCPGHWDMETGKQMSPETCQPMKSGDCYNACPIVCGKDETMCPGEMDSQGCMMPDFCHFGDFCPTSCEEGQMMCPGHWDFETGKQMGPDTCMPMSNGDCPNYCPTNCGKDDQICVGGMGPDGCPMPDYCMPMDIACPEV